MKKSLNKRGDSLQMLDDKCCRVQCLLAVHDWIAPVDLERPIFHDWQVFPVSNNRDRGAPDRPRRFQPFTAIQ